MQQGESEFHRDRCIISIAPRGSSIPTQVCLPKSHLLIAPVYVYNHTQARREQENTVPGERFSVIRFAPCVQYEGVFVLSECFG